MDKIYEQIERTTEMLTENRRELYENITDAHVALLSDLYVAVKELLDSRDEE
ncbi:hypothetical protein ACNPM2_03675 [Stenotrophomonas geniculata]|uniref:hypothetical protein n=1 Tax=Stenotrophomonas TaxID=40323 RepID=UPI001780EFF9|nr:MULTISPECIES: hypothetical protein [unclassified Stenotrophomonas]MCW8340546.1 hypothetical protein [Stenotrophomonas sp. SG1]